MCTLDHVVTGYIPFYVNFGRKYILSGNEFMNMAIQEDAEVEFDRVIVDTLRPAEFQKIYLHILMKLDQTYVLNSTKYNLR